MKLILTSALILMLTVNCLSQEKRELFKGGMFLHTGFLSNNIDQAEINGFCTGIGGKLTFRTGNHFRIGTEGYVSNYNYTDGEGFYKLGWGGLLAEYQFLNKRFTPVIGVTVGGGKISDLYPVAGEYTDNLTDAVVYKVYSSMIIAPHFSFEYKLTRNINLVVKADYLLYPGLDYPAYIAKGPRLYFGVMFSR